MEDLWRKVSVAILYHIKEVLTMNVVIKAVGEVVIRGRSSGRRRECSVHSANSEHGKSKPFHWLK